MLAAVATLRSCARRLWIVMNGLPHVRTSTSKRGSCASVAATKPARWKRVLPTPGRISTRPSTGDGAITGAGPQSHRPAGATVGRRGGADEQHGQGFDDDDGVVATWRAVSQR